MKKLYASLVMAAVAVSAFAIQPVSESMLSVKKQKNAELIDLNAVRELKASETMQRIKKSPVKKEDAAFTLEGSYVCAYDPVFTNYMDTTMTNPTTIKALGNDVYELDGFVCWSVAAWEGNRNVTAKNNIQATFTHDDDYDMDFLEIELGQELGTYAGYPLYLIGQMYDEEEEGYFYYLSGSTLMVVDQEMGVIYDGSQCAYMIGAVDTEAGKIKSWIDGGYAPMLLQPSGTLSFEYDEEEIELPIYVNFDDEEGFVILSSVCPDGNGYVLELPVEDNLITATNTIAYSNNSSSNGDIKYELTSIVTVGEKQYYDARVIMQISDDQKTITWPTGCFYDMEDYPYDSVWTILDFQNDYWYGEIGAATITLNGDSGVESVIKDNNENAPVEYFNLQGIRVDNPANGLYIKRQGSKSVKTLIR